MQLLHTHCSEQTRDHHVNVGFHFLKGYIHPLLRSTVKEILNATDIWKKKIDRGVTVQNSNHILLKASCRKMTQDWTGHKYQTNIRGITDHFTPYSLFQLTDYLSAGIGLVNISIYKLLLVSNPHYHYICSTQDFILCVIWAQCFIVWKAHTVCYYYIAFFMEISMLKAWYRHTHTHRDIDQKYIKSKAYCNRSLEVCFLGSTGIQWLYFVCTYDEGLKH